MLGLELNIGDTISYADGIDIDVATIVNIYGSIQSTHCSSSCRVQFYLTSEVTASRFTASVIKINTARELLHEAYPELLI
jgi:hypothetical protein